MCICVYKLIRSTDEIHQNISMVNNSPYSVTISNRGERKEVRKYVKGESRNEAVIPRQGTSVGKFSECLCSGGGNKLELIKEECRVNKGKRLT